MTPAYSIMAGGTNIQGRMVSLEVTDTEGNESDKAVIEIDDRNCEVALPAKGTPLTIAMGYKETGLSFMGVFKISEVETTGHPRKITINATAADFGNKSKQPRNDGYEDQTLQQVYGKMAGRSGLAAQVHPELASKKHKYLAQSAHSDLAFGTDLARRHGANMKISNGQMIVAPAGAIVFGIVTVRGELAGGADVIDYNAKAMLRPAFGKATASWWDRDAVEQKKEQASAGSGSAEFMLNHHHQDQEEAQDAAEGKGGEKASEEGGVNLTIVGRPGVRAMMGCLVVGVRPGSADGLWVIKTATHRIDDGGYTTKIDAGLPGKGGGGQGGN